MGMLPLEVTAAEKRESIFIQVCNDNIIEDTEFFQVVLLDDTSLSTSVMYLRASTQVTVAVTDTTSE